MSADAGNVGIYGSTVGGVVTTTGGVTGWVNEYAIVIGLTLTIISLVVGVVIKIITIRRSERILEKQHRERMEEAAQAHEALRVEMMKSLRAGQNVLKVP